MRLSFCPFSLGLFVGSAYYATMDQRRRLTKPLRAISDRSDNSDASLGSSTTAAVTATTTTTPAAVVAASTTTTTAATESFLPPPPVIKSLPSCSCVFVLGGPGAGKGTQCQLLRERLLDAQGIPCWAHLSAGDLLRAERSKGGELGQIINACIDNGQLVPSEVTCQLIENGMSETYLESGITKFLIDGFPRSEGNAQAWKTTMAMHTVEFVLVFECPEDVLVGRLLERGQASGRTDDNIDVIRKRFQTHQKETKPIVDLYEKEGRVRRIASDQAVEDVYREAAALFANLN